MKVNNATKGIIQVPRNILLAGQDFDYFELSVVVELLLQYRDYLSMGEIVQQELPPIKLDYSAITKRNIPRTDVFEKLLDLRRKDIRYYLRIPGVAIEVTTGLFSSVVRDTINGRVFVTVAREAVPWLIALSKGYSYLDMCVFEACNSLYLRRFYFYLLRNMIKGNACFSAKIEDIRYALGCPKTMSTHQIEARVLSKFKAIIDSLECRHTFEYEPIFKKGESGVGRKRMASFAIKFLIREQYRNDGDKYSRVLWIMNQYYNNTDKSKLRNLADVVNEIVDNPFAVQTFFNLDANYRKRFQNNYTHVANTVFLALRDRVGINPFLSLQKNTTREKNES